MEEFFLKDFREPYSHLNRDRKVNRHEILAGNRENGCLLLSCAIRLFGNVEKIHCALKCTTLPLCIARQSL